MLNYSKSPLFKILLLILLFLVGCEIYSQSIDNLKEQQALTLNGFISTNQIINLQPYDTTNSGANYNSYYTGSLNFNIYGINTPLTFIYSNNKGNFTHPFNQFGMHPSYKWVKGHIGYATMSFTPYTLSGHLFLGAGVEADIPGKLYVSAMAGRLKKAVEQDTTNPAQLPAYKRIGYGLKIGVAEDGNFIDVSIFKAYDVENSLNYSSGSTQLLPQDNTAMSVSFNKQLFGNLVFSGEIAGSHLTTDSRTEKVSLKNSFLKPPAWFMSTRAATIRRKALKSNLTYKQNRYSLGLGYERVDPDYQTLGAYYFTNNMENMTLNFSINFLENKIALSGNTGLQRDNLDQSKLNNTKRFVGSGNINIVPGEKLNLNMGYSNFSSYTNVRSSFDYINETDPYENYDTLNFRQISQSTNLNGSYQLSSDDKKRQSINLNLTWQTSNDEQENDTVTVSNFYNSAASYVLSLVPLDLTINAAFNMNINEIVGADNYTLGPVIGVSKLLFKKTLRTSLNTSYNKSTTKGFPSANVFNLRFGAAYTLKKKHNINTNVLYQRRQSQQIINTYSITLGYVYNFNIIESKEKNNNSEND